ncbi:MAG: hypothetical protein DRJ03_31600 [Chloroflexi bacterium]|nr:MAG: hypothetical protein DRJ03_31600 [Chloroflexota bacterium]
MASIRLLQPPEYTAEEQRALVDFVLALRKGHIQDLLRRADLPRSGTKHALRERLEAALDEGRLTYEEVVDFLDSVAPWGKQHVFLFNGPRSNLRAWKDPQQFKQLLKRHRVGKLLNARLPLILPDELTLSSITHLDGRLRVTAVQKREYTERAPEHDGRKETDDGEKITLRAYVHHLSRTIVVFEWDLDANTAMLQITQLDRDTLCEEMAKEFFTLVGNWLDIGLFGLVDLRRVIRRLHELERSGQAEVRSHGIHYRSLQGRRVSAHSASPHDSVLGEPVIDQAMDIVSKNGVGHLGNFYWLGGITPGPVSNPLNGDVHVIIVGDKSRINFPTPNTEDVVRYVLHRVRALG